MLTKEGGAEYLRELTRMANDPDTLLGRTCNESNSKCRERYIAEIACLALASQVLSSSVLSMIAMLPEVKEIMVSVTHHSIMLGYIMAVCPHELEGLYKEMVCKFGVEENEGKHTQE